MTDNSMSIIKQYGRSPEIMQRFAEIIGNQNAGAYVASVLLAVASSDKLQECTPQSIFGQAMRAATLRLSCDPGTGHAYLVPFKGRATLIVGYKGLIQLAMRTNKYRYINVGPIYEGEEVTFDRMSGMARIEGVKVSQKIIGYIGAFELLTGFSKAIYMSVDEIHEHAKKYSKSYNFSDSGWKTNPRDMEKKTVLRQLITKWGYLDPLDASMLVQEEDSGEDLPEENDVTIDGEVRQLSQDQIMSELGFLTPTSGGNGNGDNGKKPEISHSLSKMTLETAQAVKSSDGTLYGEITSEKLSHMSRQITESLKKNGLTDERKTELQMKLDAIAVILESRNSH